MPTTTPRQDVRAAFKAILDAAALGVPVHERRPYEGAEIRSVVLTLVSGSNQVPSLGMQHSSTERALESRYRLQIDCYHDEQTECERLADKVDQAITDHLETLRSTYDIHDVKKIVDTDTAPPEPGLHEGRILMDYEFYTHRTVT